MVFDKCDPPAQTGENLRAQEDKKGKWTPPCPGYSDLRRELRSFRPCTTSQPAVAPFRAPHSVAPPWPEEELLPGLPPPPVAARGHPQPSAPPWPEGELLPGLPPMSTSGGGTFLPSEGVVAAPLRVFWPPCLSGTNRRQRGRRVLRTPGDQTAESH